MDTRSRVGRAISKNEDNEFRLNWNMVGPHRETLSAPWNPWGPTYYLSALSDGAKFLLYINAIL